MNDSFNRRAVLKHSTTTITGLALFSGETLALESKQQVPESSDDDDHELPTDLWIHNNSTGNTTIEITAYPKNTDGPVFEGSYSLPGLNDPSLENPSDASQEHQLKISGEGTYTFQFQLPDGSTDSTDVTVTDDGIYGPESMSVYIRPSGQIRALTTVW